MTSTGEPMVHDQIVFHGWLIRIHFSITQMFYKVFFFRKSIILWILKFIIETTKILFQCYSIFFKIFFSYLKLVKYLFSLASFCCVPWKLEVCWLNTFAALRVGGFVREVWDTYLINGQNCISLSLPSLRSRTLPT